MVNTGMKARDSIIIECVGPRCSKVGMRMSMSGMTDSVRTMGMLIFVLRTFANALLKTYPSAKCPTANDSFPSLFQLKTGEDWD